MKKITCADLSLLCSGTFLLSLLLHGSNEGRDFAEDPEPGKVVQEQVLAFVHQVLDYLEGCQVALVIILEKNEDTIYKHKEIR